MGGLSLALILSGVVMIRGALKGLDPLDSFRDVFDRARGGAGFTLDNILDRALARDPLPPETSPEDRQDGPR